MRRPERYQLALIALGMAALLMYWVFVYREIAPEYKVFQDSYIALEKFRSSYTSEPPPPFEPGIKQILLVRDDKGPPIIDRCTSCHVALQIDYFSPTKIAYDINGNMIFDIQGIPQKVPNENYIWNKVDQKIANLTDPKVIATLKAEGDNTALAKRLDEAEKLQALKSVTVGNQTYDVTRALRMHPLIGKETRPFEFHPMDDYGCVICHNGNGRALTVDKAHGPVFDGEYPIEFEGPRPEFVEPDPDNDPLFAYVFNHKPGPTLLFQTTPLFVGNLIQAKCVQCHQPSSTALEGSLYTATALSEDMEKKVLALKKSFNQDKQALISLLDLRKSITENGMTVTIANLKEKSQNYALPTRERDQSETQLQFLAQQSKEEPAKVILNIDQQIQQIIGSDILAKQLITSAINASSTLPTIIGQFLNDHRGASTEENSIFAKAAVLNYENEMIRHVRDTQSSFSKAIRDQQFMSAVSSDIDTLTADFRHGQQLFISQACYACHRISGFARGGIGPELTRSGETAPWFLKQKISWPQGDLPTSTMPNYKLDHDELESIMTYVLAQKGQNLAISPTEYKIRIQEWEAGRKMPWEKPVPPSKIHDLRYSMTVFATEGCAACHRLQGYESNVGFAIEKDSSPEFDAIYQEQQWFSQLFPEEIAGSQIVAALDQNQIEIDKRIIDHVRQNSLLEEINANYPSEIEGLYTNFKYALRAKNHEYSEKIVNEVDPIKKQQWQSELDAWKARVQRVLMMYIQQYGLGRFICPRPNWSGIFRSDDWLIEHFQDPTSHSPKSLMPPFPFDISKFYALTYMLDVLGIRNRDAVRAIWQHNGFDPAEAFQIHCAQCHGEFRSGNGPVSQWIYPIPKNLRNEEFLRNLTKEYAIQSITHGIKGTPMPPWGEVATDKTMANGIPVLTENEIAKLVNWLFTSVPGGEVIKSSKDVPKWQYTPQDVLKELNEEGNPLPKALPENKHKSSPLSALAPKDFMLNLFASLEPIPSSMATEPTISDLFDVQPNPVPGPEKQAYYIKKKFYTEANIEAGKTFFELNCATCHGKEADGAGERASVMQEAKPQMLINLDWLHTRDDLRLLRSIKYGIPGTAMTPWGDLTSMLQRLQLVIFIRSLSEELNRRYALSDALYQAFKKPQLSIDLARINHYKVLEETQKQYDQIAKQLNDLQDKFESGSNNILPETGGALYQKQLLLLDKLRKQEETDDLFNQLKLLIETEASLYKEIGQNLINQHVGEELYQQYLNLIRLHAKLFQVDRLQISIDPAIQREIVAQQERLVNQLNNNINVLEADLFVADSQQTSLLTEEFNRVKKLYQGIVSNFAEARRTQKRQLELVTDLQSRITDEGAL